MADPVGDGVRQPGDFSAARRLHPTEPGCSIGMIKIYAVEEQHVKMDIEVQRRAKALEGALSGFNVRIIYAENRGNAQNRVLV